MDSSVLVRDFGNLFRLEGLLGSGAFSDIHRAFCLDDVVRCSSLKGLAGGCVVALKSPKSVSQNGVARFSRESGILDVIGGSEGVVSYFGCLDTSGGVPVLVEEVAESDLERFCQNVYPGGLPGDVAASFLKSIARGLSSLHKVLAGGKDGYTHRDIKPSNILVFNNGTLAKLGDFGSAGVRDNPSIGMTGSTSGVYGCDVYAAPESINYDEERRIYTVRSDIYSLGLLAFFMHTGFNPFQKDGHDSSIRMLKEKKESDYLDDVVDKELRSRGVAEQRIAAIRDALNPNPTNRQDSVNDFIEEYSKILVSSPTLRKQYSKEVSRRIYVPETSFHLPELRKIKSLPARYHRNIACLRRARSIIDAIKRNPALYKPEGLVRPSFVKELHTQSTHVNSSDNFYFAMLLNAVGEREEALSVLEAMKSVGLQRADGLYFEQRDLARVKPERFSSFADGLQDILLEGETDEDERRKIIKSIEKTKRSDKMHEDMEREKENRYSFYDNTLLAMLLHNLGYNDEADRVIRTIEEEPNFEKNILYYDRLKRFGESKIKDYISTTTNSVFAMLLYRMGYYEKAEEIVESITKLFCKNDGLLDRDDRLGSKDISIISSIYWGLLLHIMGVPNEAQEIVDDIKRTKAVMPNGLLYAFCQKDGRHPGSLAYTEDSIFWGMLLQATGNIEESESKVIESLLSSGCHRDDNLLTNGLSGKDCFDGALSSQTNSLWGLLLLGDGYKVFTGR